MSVQLSSIISSQIYRDNDKPYYYTGNKALLAVVAYNIVVIIGMKLYYNWRNSSRDKIWASMSREERVQYLSTTKDEGNKRLNFRFGN